MSTIQPGGDATNKLPSQFSGEAFWHMITKFSELGGYLGPAHLRRRCLSCSHGLASERINVCDFSGTLTHLGG
jgi:hypothetical protein